MKRIFDKIMILSYLAFGVTTFGAKEVKAYNATMKEYNYLMSGTARVGETSKAEQILTEINHRGLLNKQPPPKIEWSLERDNLIRRTKLWNDRNKLSYIYLFTKDTIIGFYAIKGKVSSVNSTLTNPEFVNVSSYGNVTLPSPAEDGSYGSNGDAVFFFLADGTYMEWNGQYLLTDTPLKLNVTPMTSM
ncbi:MAG: hypothetical protein ACRC92_20190 [Peptostreptococcaceae bacterium]